MQAITVAVKSKECVLDKPGNWIRLQPASAPTLVEQFVAQSLGPICILKTLMRLSRKTIGESEGDELDDVL
jgi:hypothetical protein